jgi:hypothetical protein
MCIKPTVNDVFGIRIYGTEDAGEYLKRQLILHAQLQPETPRTEIGHGQSPEVFCRDTNLIAHAYSLNYGNSKSTSDMCQGLNRRGL